MAEYPDEFYAEISALNAQAAAKLRQTAQMFNDAADLLELPEPRGAVRLLLNAEEPRQAAVDTLSVLMQRMGDVTGG